MEISTVKKMIIGALFLGLAFFVLMMGRAYAQSNYPRPLTEIYASEIK